MSEPFIAEIRMCAFSFAARGWAQCNGQLLPISQNQALFSLLGTTYGGNGTTTFALPDLRGRVPLHAVQGPGLPNVVLGEAGGAEAVTLNQNQLPPHGHGVRASSDLAGATSPAGAVTGAKPRGGADIYSSPGSLTPLAAGAVGSAGGSQPHSNTQPSVVVNFVIALVGIFPSRN
jgi:microcystin-dependent protein